MKKLFFSLFSLASFGISAQIGYWPNDTLGDDNSTYAIQNITLYRDSKTKIEHAVLVFKEGKILAAGNVPVPKNAVVIDGKNSFVYPSFIDPYSTLNIPVKAKESRQTSIYLPSDPTSSAYNDAVKADVNAFEHFKTDSKEFQTYIDQGFGSALLFNNDGIVRGSGVLTLLGNDEPSKNILKNESALLLSFDKGTSKQSYPTSLAGSIALIRQLYLDADWYAKSKTKTIQNTTIEAFNRLKKLPTIFETTDKWDILRADKIGDEAGFQYIFLGSGNEYQRHQEIKATKGTIILPLEYPKAYRDEDLLNLDNLEVADLKHWELAPYNAVFLAKESIGFAFTMNKLKDKSTFFKKLRELNQKGLTKEQILHSLTQKPAEILEISQQLGTLDPGKLANFVIFSEDIFSKDAIIYENWIRGRQNIINSFPKNDLRGDYHLNINGNQYLLKIKGKQNAPTTELILDKDKGNVKLVTTDLKTGLHIELPKDSINNYRVYFQPEAIKNLQTLAIDKNGNKVPISINWIKNYEETTNADEAVKQNVIGIIWYPFNAFGEEQLPVQKDYLIKNTTIWSNTSKGILTNQDVLISKGKIAQIGKGISANGAVIIDGSLYNLTNGIIDEHTHIGISKGVNEAGANCSAEVSMADVINPDDINFYRQLAGGVTSAQQLHGSANPIGGQSSIVKFKWGENAENMKFPGAPKTIKFALGENVKQSNWDNNPNRFPQSRSGVEQAFDFWFTRAKEYEKDKKTDPNFRKDLRLETLVEILENERHITCHSYVQSEINMLMKLADELGFRVNTFTHILEGYKVADKMKNRNINASTFSDWWAYKEEVREAIPYNAALLLQAGVNTAINSDDAEMARRLNQEAGKVVKYGNISQEEAWKTVTLNPAKMMYLDKKVGTVEIGKDADLVLWTNNPLSIYAKVNKTFVDGILYYDADIQPAKDKKVTEEKNRIIQKMLFSDEKKEKKELKKEEKKNYHCDTLEAF